MKQYKRVLFVATAVICLVSALLIGLSIQSAALYRLTFDLNKAEDAVVADIYAGDIIGIFNAGEMTAYTGEDAEEYDTIENMLICKVMDTKLYVKAAKPGTVKFVVAESAHPEKTHTFTLTATLIDINEVVMMKDVENKVYNGKAQAQDIKTFMAGYTPTYRLEYSDNVNPGEQYLDLVGTGYFTGTKRLYYQTTMPAASFKSFAQSKNAIKVNLNPLEGVCYQLQVKKGNGTFQTIDLKTATSKLFSGLTFKDRYAFRTRAYTKVNGKNVFGAWSAVENKVVGLSLNDCVITGVVNQVYNGKAQAQNVKVTYKGKPIKVKLTYSNNKAIGYRYVTVSGTGDFADSVRVYYYIVPAAPKITGLVDYYNESLDAMISQVKFSAVAGGVSGYQIAAQAKGASKWTYFTTTGLSRNMKLPEDKIYTVMLRAYKKFENGVTVYGKWSAAERVFPTDQWLYTYPMYYTGDTLKGYVTKAMAGDKIVIAVKGKKYTVTVGKDSKQFNFQVKVGKFAAGTTLAVKYYNKFNQLKLSVVTPVYLSDDLQKGYTGAQVKLVPGFEEPDRVSKQNGNVIWEYVWQLTETKGIYGVLTFKGGKLAQWEYYDVTL